ncbi:hypothetical protein CHUAL_002227 [Chamberlinius hualienensis]
MSAVSQLDIWDYVSLSVVVLASSSVGLYQVYSARKISDTNRFLITNSNTGLAPLILSTVSTYISAITLLGFPAEIYTNGLSFSIQVLANTISIPLGMYLFLPVVYNLHPTSVFEYVERRFGKVLSTFMTFTFIAEKIMICGIMIYAPSLALNQVTGIHLWASTIAIVVGAVIYTAMGGIKAVIWADAGQCIVMLGTFILIAIKGINDVGGLNVVWGRSKQGHRSDIFIWSSSPYSKYSFWTLAVGMSIHFTYSTTLNQFNMQRYLSNKTLKRAQINYAGAALCTSALFILLSLGGITMYAYYDNCDPLLSRQITRRDQLMVLFAMEILSFCPGLPGLFIGAIMCATLSSITSLLNSMTALTVKEIVYFKPEMSGETTKKLSKILVVWFALLSIAAAIMADNFGGLIESAYSIEGIHGGASFVVYTIGMLLPWVHLKGVVVGFMCSTILPIWVTIGSKFVTIGIHQAPLSIENCVNMTYIHSLNITQTTETSLLHYFYSIPAQWYISWCLVTGIAASLIASMVIGFQSPKNVDANLLFTFIRRYFKSKQFAVESQLHSNEHQPVSKSTVNTTC